MLSTVNDDNNYHYDSYLYKYYSFSLQQARPLYTTRVFLFEMYVYCITIKVKHVIFSNI